MSYRRSSKKSQVSRWIYTVIILIVFFLIYPYISGFFMAPKNFLLRLAYPLWQTQAEAEQNKLSIFSYFSGKKELLDANRELKEKVGKLDGLTAINTLLSDENEQLKSMLGRPPFYSHRVLATILIRPGRVPFDTLIIDIGKKDGVAEGAHVYAVDTTVIGRVTEVFETTSRVILYSSPGESVAVLIGPENIGAEAKGLGGGNFEIILPREVPIEEGNTINIPGIEPFVLGVVGYIQKEPSDAFQRILFKSTANIQEIKFVEVLIR